METLSGLNTKWENRSRLLEREELVLCRHRAPRSIALDEVGKFSSQAMEVWAYRPAVYWGVTFLDGMVCKEAKRWPTNSIYSRFCKPSMTPTVSLRGGGILSNYEGPLLSSSWNYTGM